MERYCYYCGSKLSFRDIFILSKKPTCSDCHDYLKKLDPQRKGFNIETNKVTQDNKLTEFYTFVQKAIRKKDIERETIFAIAVVSIIIGFAFGYIFIFPLILLFIGLYILYKGMPNSHINENDKKIESNIQTLVTKYVTCPNCKTNLELNENEVISKQYTCPACNEFVNYQKL
jgi:Ca2+-dependent lipid-binding protein